MKKDFKSIYSLQALDFIKQATRCNTLLEMQRARMQNIAKVVARENDLTESTRKTRLMEQAGDPTKFRNIIAPVISPAVENAVTYQMSVFCTGYPMFEFLGDPDDTEAAEAITAKAAADAEKGGWFSEMSKFFRDAVQYNIGHIEVTWEQEASYAVSASPDTKSGTAAKSIMWSGNKIKRLDPFNVFRDTSVEPHEVAAKGEYIGYFTPYTRTGLRNFMASLNADNLLLTASQVFKSESAGTGFTTKYFQPLINTDLQVDSQTEPGINWDELFGGKAAKTNKNNAISDNTVLGKYLVTTIYVRVFAEDLFGETPNQDNSHPEIWKFISVGDNTLIYAEKLTNRHNWFPILTAQAKEVGLGDQTRSIAEDLIPIQSCQTAMYNSVINTLKRAVSDRAIYNPRLIDTEHLDNDSVTAKIPLKPGAPVGTNPALAYHQIPFDASAAAEILAHMPVFKNMTFEITGQNPARGGQFVKGNKTQSEFESVMANANGRDQVMAIHFESRIMTPMKQIILANTLLNQTAETVRSPDKSKMINIDPVALQDKAYSFKVSDGLVPSEKLINTEALAVALQTLQAVPQLAGSFDLAKLFTYFMNIKGADIEEFELSPEEIKYQQAMSAWAQQAQLAATKGAPFNVQQPKPEDYGIQSPTNSAGPNEQSAGGATMDQT